MVSGRRSKKSSVGAPAATSPLSGLIERQNLRRLAGGRSFERGEDYFAGGRVGDLAEDRGKVVAEVHGTRTYRVALWAEGGALEYSCTCPVGQDGDFCKHCVAVGLTWLDPGRDAPKALRKREKPSVTMKDVRGWLANQDPQKLVDLLMEQAMADGRLQQRLVLEVARRGGKGLDLRTYRRAIDAAVNVADFVDYEEAFDYAHGIEEAVKGIAALLKDGYAVEVIELAEYALERVEGAIEHMDDSDGHMSGILEQLQTLHLTACKQAKPDPEALAKRLFAWELRTEWDTFYGAAATYADILGTSGLATYRKLAEAEWARVPARGPADQRRDDFGKRFRITHIMETLATQTGDVEARVAVKQRDLSSSYAHLQIAEIYKEAKQPDRALEWAERGIRAFPKNPDPRLQDFLAEEYHRRKRHDEAMAMIWTQYAAQPYLETYQKLKQHADRIGQWTPWREKALAAARQVIAAAKQQASRGSWAWAERADHSELVRIFLWEKDVDAVWAEAKAGGCARDLWLELAARREKDHPEDALTVYQAQVEPTLNRKNNDAYREAIGLLRKARTLLVRLNREKDFGDFLATLRLTHKPKRNFMKLLDHARW
jgi:uncharacterized Zn finger protein